MAHNRPRTPGNASSLQLEKYTGPPSVSRGVFCTICTPSVRHFSHHPATAKLRAFRKLCTLDDTNCGGAGAPVILPAFKAGDSALRESNGGFDSHTLPPFSSSEVVLACRVQKTRLKKACAC